MELSRLIAALSDPAAYSHPAADVRVIHTHISVVFLAGEYAYKLKKPVDLGFLDFTTLEKRRWFCDEEVRLNRRLAPSVYLGVVPVVVGAGGVRVGQPGDAVEWLVQMRRLPEGASLLDRLGRGEIDAPLVEDLAGRVAAFHAGAEAGARVAEFGRHAVVAGNARENLTQTEPRIGITISRAVFDRLRSLTDDSLARLRPLIESRAERRVPRDTHGDLHLDHVYYFPDRPPPDDLVVIDCIEFSERFRFADPFADAAFLAMDLAFRGRRDLAARFSDAYLRASGDAEGAALLPFYTAYRAAVRAKVEGLQLDEAEIPEVERASALTRARGHWLLALGELEEPLRKPCLVLVAGLPGSGKSTLARSLAQSAGFEVIRSDVVRKELAGVSQHESARAEIDGGLYTVEWSDRTYAECLRRVEGRLFEGGRVIVDASFGSEARRRVFLDAAVRWGVPAVLLVCRASLAVSRARIAARRGDASDADAAVYEQAVLRWEAPGQETQRVWHELHADAAPDATLGVAQEVLRAVQLGD